MSKLYRQLATELHRAFKALHENFHKLADKYGLAPAQMAALHKLWQRGSMSVTELGERLGCNASTITALVDRMERDGLVVRERDQTDRRVVNIKLTQKSLQLKGKAPALEEVVRQAAEASLTRDEVKQLTQLLSRFAHALETELQNSNQE